MQNFILKLYKRWMGTDFFKKGQSRPLFVNFCLFCMTQFKYKLIKALMVYLGLDPWKAGSKAQTNPLSYGGAQ